jgi:hypothetical protein
MECPHCNKAIAWNPESLDKWVDEKDSNYTIVYELLSDDCPACERKIIILHTKYGKPVYGENNPPQYITHNQTEEIFYPKYKQAKGIEPEVPETYKKNFIEAYLVSQISPKASAALSRRLLQIILREEFNIKQRDLAKEIDEFIKLPNIPPVLVEAIDAIRNIGNFAAHPIKSTSTGEIVDVEIGEADWLLEIIEMLFNFTFVQPKREKEKRDKLNQKLKDLGKPPMKS